MLRIYLFILSNVLTACTRSDGTLNSTADICDINLKNTIKFTDLAVHTFTDRHGSYLTIDLCPNHTVAVDFSDSDLYVARHKELLKKMRVSSYQGGSPLKMRISGSYKGSDGKDRPATIVVDEILEHELSR